MVQVHYKAFLLTQGAGHNRYDKRIIEETR